MNLEDVLKLKTPDDLWHYMHNNIKYCWTNKEGKEFSLNSPNMMAEYYIHSASETCIRKSGICLDQVVLEKTWFDYHGIENHIITLGFIENGLRVGGGHTFLYYFQNNNYYYFENAFVPAANIVKVTSLDELIGIAVAIYLLCTKNVSKIDNIYITIDSNIKIGDNTQSNYTKTLNDQDVISKYKDEIEKAIIKYQ